MKKHNDQFDISYCFTELLASYGIQEVIISPGYRSTPFIWALHQHYQRKTIKRIWVIDDERQAGFLGLGLSGEANNPVLLVCTSGSAVFHYFPAIVEAYHCNKPLIVMSADRPWEALWCNEDQTTNQDGLFKGYAPTLTIQAEKGTDCIDYLEKSIEIFINQSWRIKKGPLHFNVSYKKPLWTKRRINNQKEQVKNKNIQLHYKPSYSESLLSDMSLINQQNKMPGLIVLGEKAIQNPRQVEALIQLANHLDCVIAADILSGVFLYNHPRIYKVEEVKEWIVNQKIGYVIHIGKRVLDRNFWDYLANKENVWIHIRLPDQNEVDIKAKVSSQFLGNIEDFFDTLKENEVSLKRIEMSKRSQTLQWNQQIRKAQKEQVNTKFVCWYIQQQMKEDTGVFLANSQAIRFMAKYATKRTKNSQIRYNGQRGVNGIDGQLAHAIGLSIREQKRMIIVIGDKALYHDFNSLFLLDRYKKEVPPLFIVCLNNNGGEIFNVVAQDINKECREKYLVSRYEWDLSFIKQISFIKYHSVQSDVEYVKLFDKWNEGGLKQKTVLVEVKLD